MSTFDHCERCGRLLIEFELRHPHAHAEHLREARGVEEHQERKHAERESRA